MPRIDIVDKEVIYRSKIYFTPLRSATEIDAEAVKRIVREEYQAAGMTPEMLRTGAVIITGETARKENANEVLEALSDLAGDFVVATAGPDLESVLSARGAGILGFSIFGTRPCYALDEHMELDLDGVRAFLEEHQGETIFLFGFTFIIWKHVVRALEERGVIEEYTTIVNPQKISGAVSCYFELEVEPAQFSAVGETLRASDTVTQIYQVSGRNKLHVHAVAAGQGELEDFLDRVIHRLPGVASLSCNIILSRIKDIKGLRL